MINSYLAASKGIDSTSDGRAARVSAAWRDWLWDASAMVKQVDATFDPGIGFVRRRGMRDWFGTVGLHPRPAVTWLQELNPLVEMHQITNTDGLLETRAGTAGLGVSFTNASRLSLELHDQFERLLDPFKIFADVVIPAGEYRFRDVRLSYTSSQNQNLAGRVSLSAGGFWSGTQRSVGLGASWRSQPGLYFELSGDRSDVDLPQGGFVADLVSGRVRFATSTRLFGSAFVQYNAETDQLVTNLRLDFRHAPLSDLFVVFVDRHDLRTGTVLDRSLALKVTKLFAF